MEYKELKVSLSTADILGLSIRYEKRELFLSIIQYGGKVARVKFVGVAMFSWDESKPGEISASPDRVYEVVASEALEAWPSHTGLRHFLLGFCGVTGFSFLDVVASGFSEEDGASLTNAL